MLLLLLAATVGVAVFNGDPFAFANDPLPTISFTNTTVVLLDPATGLVDTTAVVVSSPLEPFRDGGIVEYWRQRTAAEESATPQRNETLSPYVVHFASAFDAATGTEADVFRIFGGFSTIQEAILTVFELFTVDGWSRLMYAAMYATPENGGAPVGEAIYFVLVAVVIGALISAMMLSLMVVSFVSTAVQALAEARYYSQRGRFALTRCGVEFIVHELPEVASKIPSSFSSPPLSATPRSLLSPTSSASASCGGAEVCRCAAFAVPLPPPAFGRRLDAAELHAKYCHCGAAQRTARAFAVCEVLASAIAEELELREGLRAGDTCCENGEGLGCPQHIHWPPSVVYRCGAIDCVAFGPNDSFWALFDDVAASVPTMQRLGGTRAASAEAESKEVAAHQLLTVLTPLPSEGTADGESRSAPKVVEEAPAESNNSMSPLQRVDALRILLAYVADSQRSTEVLALGFETVGGAVGNTSGGVAASLVSAMEVGTAADVKRRLDEESSVYGAGLDGGSGDDHHDAFAYFPVATPFLRRIARHVIDSHAFHRFVLLCIFGSCAILVLNSPRFEWSEDAKTALLATDVSLLSVFVIDILLKMVANGLFTAYDDWDKGAEHNNGGDKKKRVDNSVAFFRSGWNILDLVIVALSFASLGIPKTYGAGSLSYAFKALKAAKALLPLEFIVHLPGLQAVSRSLLGAAGSMLGVAVLGTVHYIVFAIIGVTLFMGRFHHCSDPAVGSLEAHRAAGMCEGTFYYTMATEPNRTFAAERQWIVPDRNFDNVGNAILTLFEVGTGEGMSTLMFEAVTRESFYDPQSVGARAFFSALYFVVFFALTRFVLLNLLVAVVVFHLNSVRRASSTSAFLTAAQTSWVESRRLLYRFRPAAQLQPPARGIGDSCSVRTNGDGSGRSFWRRASSHVGDAFFAVRLACYRLLKAPAFEAAILALIIGNTVVLAMEYYGMSSAYDEGLDIANHALALAFIAELAVRLLCSGWRRCFLQSHWFRLDLLVSVLAVVDFALFMKGQSMAVSVGPGAMRSFRLLRVIRLLRLLRDRTNVEMLAEAALFSLPPLLNVLVLLAVIFFVYAIAGVQLFAFVRHNGALNAYYNFEHIGNALQLLFVMATGERWTEVMHACMLRPPRCGATDCGANTAPIYFVSFIVVCRFILINVFVEVVLEAYAGAMRLSRRRSAACAAVSHNNPSSSHSDPSQQQQQSFERRRRPLGDLEVLRRSWERFDGSGSQLMPMEQLPALLSSLPAPFGYPYGIRGVRGGTAAVSGRARPLPSFLSHLRAAPPLVDFGGFVHYTDLLVKESRGDRFAALTGGGGSSEATCCGGGGGFVAAPANPLCPDGTGVDALLAPHASPLIPRLDDPAAAEEAIVRARLRAEASAASRHRSDRSWGPIVARLAVREDVTWGAESLCASTAERWFAARRINALVRGALVRRRATDSERTAINVAGQ